MGATKVGMALAMAGYMAPEQARGKTVDKRADIWAFGVVVYEMLTGRRAFQGEDVSDTLAAVIKEQPQWDDVPLNVRRLLQSCLEKDPKRRLRDIGDAWRLLDEPAPARGLPDRRSLLPWIVAGVLSLAALALASFHFREAPPPERILLFSIPAPPKTTLQSFALSPDGRYLAMAAMMDGKTQLWLRALEALQPQPVPGTEDAQFRSGHPTANTSGSSHRESSGKSR